MPLGLSLSPFGFSLKQPQTSCPQKGLPGPKQKAAAKCKPADSTLEGLRESPCLFNMPDYNTLAERWWQLLTMCSIFASKLSSAHLFCSFPCRYPGSPHVARKSQLARKDQLGQEKQARWTSGLGSSTKQSLQAKSCRVSQA